MIIKKYKLYLESLKNEKDMWSIIPESVKELHQLFKQKNKQLFIVGGAIRDFLNNQKPKDFDLENCYKVLKSSNYKGWVSLEYEGPKEPTAMLIKMKSLAQQWLA